MKSDRSILSARASAVLAGLLEFEPTMKSASMSHTAGRGGGTPRRMPPGMEAMLHDGQSAPPKSVSPYAHFRWHFEHQTDAHRRQAFVMAAELELLRLRRPRTPRSEEDADNLRKGVQRGDEVAVKILTQYVGYESDIVDIIESQKPGTTRRVRQTNYCDELGQPKGIPNWRLNEFEECLDAGLSMDRIMATFQISERTYFTKKALLKKRARV